MSGSNNNNDTNITSTIEDREKRVKQSLNKNLVKVNTKHKCEEWATLYNLTSAIPLKSIHD